MAFSPFQFISPSFILVTIISLDIKIYILSEDKEEAKKIYIYRQQMTTEKNI